ncbi:MAG: ABC transporter ATP-binding protein [Vulcanimicrobiaceae bacterium]
MTILDSLQALPERVCAETVAALHNVSKRYDSTVALDGFDLELHRGELLALLGPNGAGKTTAVALMLGIRRPDSGSATLFGRDPRDLSVRQRIGVAPQFHGFPPMLTVAETVDFVRRHYPRAPLLRELLERYGLNGLEKRQTRTLSGGQRKVLGLALAFAGDPELVFLDEPTAGLDTLTRRILWGILAGFVRRGGTVLLTTHHLDEAEALATRVALLLRGRVAREGSVREIVRGVGIARVSYAGEDVGAGLPGVVRIERGPGGYTLYTEDADTTVRALVASGARFVDLTVAPASLEEAFVAYTTGGAA